MDIIPKRPKYYQKISDLGFYLRKKNNNDRVQVEIYILETLQVRIWTKFKECCKIKPWAMIIMGGRGFQNIKILT